MRRSYAGKQWKGIEKELGSQHLSTTDEHETTMAGMLRDQGKVRRGRRGLNRRALEGREKELGAQHPDTLTSHEQPGRDARVPGGKYDEAEKA